MFKQCGIFITPSCASLKTYSLCLRLKPYALNLPSTLFLNIICPRLFILQPAFLQEHFWTAYKAFN